MTAWSAFDKIAGALWVIAACAVVSTVKYLKVIGFWGWLAYQYHKRTSK